jgi:hypothetical protein
MRIAPHIIKPFTPRGCMDYVVDALKVVLLAGSSLVIGYGLGLGTKCPQGAFDALAKSLRLFALAFIGLIAVILVATVVLKVRAGAREDE